MSRLAYQMVGGEKAFYALSKEERLAIRATAKDMHELGVSYSAAERAEVIDTRGFVYVIVNPAWDDYCKIGRAFDPESRLAGYQTGTPFRDYELYGSRFFEDAAQAEKEIHLRLAAAREEGEWFFMEPAQALVEIDKLQEQLL